MTESKSKNNAIVYLIYAAFFACLIWALWSLWDAFNPKSINSYSNSQLAGPIKNVQNQLKGIKQTQYKALSSRIIQAVEDRDDEIETLAFTNESVYVFTMGFIALTLENHDHSDNPVIVRSKNKFNQYWNENGARSYSEVNSDDHDVLISIMNDLSKSKTVTFPDIEG